VARPALGSIKWTRNKATGVMQWHVRLTLKDGSRPPPRPLDPTIPRSDTVRAREAARLVSDLARERGLVEETKGETVTEYAKRWITSRTGKVKTVAKNEQHLRDHVFTDDLRIAFLAMTDVAREDVERVVASLDRKVTDGALSAKTAANVWGTVSKLFDDATNAKPSTGLRCLTVDPSSDVRGPDDDDAGKAKQFLYPNEFLDFVGCREVKMIWRRAVTLATYLCLRDGELRALRWADVDMDHGVVTVGQTYDRTLAADREGTKSGVSRQVAIPGTLMPLLAVMRKEAAGKGKVCPMPSMNDMSSGLRTQLRRAGVDRAALLKTTSVSLNLRFHDLRATGLTWHAVAGRPQTEIRDIAGHTNTTMTDVYVRAATIVRGGRFGQPFPELPGALLDRGGFRSEFRFDPKLPPNLPVFLCEGGDLNPYGVTR
jgi:integrase